MGNESEEPVTELGSLPLSDHYRAVLAEAGARKARELLEAIDHRLWYGRADEPPCLARELARARENGEAVRTAARCLPPEVLILVAGTSPEPLLLAVAHHAPRRVILLREESLSDHSMRRFERLWKCYHADVGAPSLERVERHTVRDDAAALYRAVERLVEAPQAGRGERVVLDITGAKKTMVAGAFLAAGMFDLETSYVDFDAYDAILRRPEPGSSRVKTVAHPVSLFRLREFQQLAAIFDARRFDEAARLARRLEEAAASGEVEEILGREPCEARAAELRFLGHLAGACDLWRQGFYRDAAAELGSLEGAVLPPQVEVLAEVWPVRSAKHQEIVCELRQEEVCSDPAVALAYFLDVLVWIDRQAVESRPRDSYLRLYGTVEAVAFWALEVLVGHQLDALEIEGSSEVDVEVCLEALAAAARGKEADGLRRLRAAALGVLRGNANKTLKVLADPRGVELDGARLVRVLTRGAGAPSGPLPLRVSLREPPLTGDAAKLLDRGRHRFSDLRNKAVHWFAPVPPERVNDLLDHYREVLATTVPLVVERELERTADADDAAHRRGADRLSGWSRELLAAAEGTTPPSCRPPTFEQARAAASRAAASGAAVGT